MKINKFTTSFALFFLLINFSVFSQNKSIEIDTSYPDAEFIPFINGRQLMMIPTDSFYIEIDTLDYLILTLSFNEENVAGIEKKVNFDNFKHKKYEIVPINYAVKTIDDLDGKEIPDNAQQKYMIKDRSALYYFKKTSSID